METLWQDVRYGVRSLLKTPGFTALAVLMLALGIGANTAIFSVVNTVLLSPLPFHNQERLVILWEEEPDNPLIEVSYPNFRDWREQSQLFEGMAALGSSNWPRVLQADTDPIAVAYRGVSTSFFETLGVAPHLGRTFRPEEDVRGASPVIVVSHGFWQRHLESEIDIIGKPVNLSGDPHTVVGIMPPGFQYPKGVEIWGLAGPELAEKRDLGVLYVIGRMKTGVALEQARSEIASIASRLAVEYETAPEARGAAITPLRDHFLGSRTRPALLALWGAVGLVLLTACSNVASLFLVRAVSRRKEMAVRLAMGAGRLRIIRQLLTESSLLGLAACLAGAILASWSLAILLKLTPGDVPRIDAVAVDGIALAATLGLGFLTAVLVGLLPAWEMSRSSASDSLREGARSAVEDRRGRFLRNLLVVLEIAMALVLLVGATLMLESFLNLRRQDLGYRPESVLTMVVGHRDQKYPTIEEKRRLVHDILEQVRSLPGVDTAGAVLNRPFAFGPIGWDLWYVVEGQARAWNKVTVQEEGKTRVYTVPEDAAYDENPMVNYEAVTPDYFRAMGTRLREGRTFTERDAAHAPPVAIVGETLAKRMWPDVSAIGKRLITYPTDWDDEGNVIWRTVVGVVETARFRELEAPRLDLYLPYLQSPMAVGHLVVRTSSDPLTLAGAVRAQIKAIDDLLPVGKVTTMEDVVASEFAPWRFNMLMFGIFAVLAVVLASLGIFGVLAYTVTQRTREIGVRFALGAQRGDVVRLVVGQGMTLTLAGLAIGLVLALTMTRFISTLLYGVSPSDPLIYVGISLLLMVVALAASYLPARRASKVEPVTALRYE